MRALFKAQCLRARSKLGEEGGRGLYWCWALLARLLPYLVCLASSLLLILVRTGNTTPLSHAHPVRITLNRRPAPEDLGQLMLAPALMTAESDWTAQDVCECWLKEQQGLESLAPAFLEKGVDGARLRDEGFFTADFVAAELGVQNKIQGKKLVMAARRLDKEGADFPAGTTFDSTAEKGPYQFVLGQRKLIRAMELGVGSMRVGERARVTCRADYGYGKDGLRNSKGEVRVPPFATLCFDIKLLGILG